MASSEEPPSLRAIFEAAEAKRNELESCPDATSPKYAENLDAALKLYGQALDQISAVALFSPNEGAEDMATSSMPYLLVDFYMAELLQRTPHLAPKQRLQVLGRARAAYEGFLSLVDGYGLVHAPYDKLLARYREDDEERFAVVAGRDAASKRDGKIASYKAEKALREKLAVLKRNPRYLEQGNEEIVREVYFTNVQFSIHATFQALDSLNRELPLLRQAPSPTTSPRAAAAGDDPADTSFRLDRPLNQLGAGGPLLSRQGKPLQPFTLVGSRADLARGVFRPGHNLPTMSIDEYLEEERRRGGILEGGTDPARPQVDEDDMEAVDRATYKARRWDDFTDENRKGAGNTLNMG